MSKKIVLFRVVWCGSSIHLLANQLVVVVVARLLVVSML